MFNEKDLIRNYNQADFTKMALEIFRFQHENNSIYKRYIEFLNIDLQKVKLIKDIPFLPISFFKDFEIISGHDSIKKKFTSSGTTGNLTSTHYLTHPEIYHIQLENSFKFFFGKFDDYHVLPLLPAYAERNGSSLIEMVDYWMEKTGQEKKEYFLYNHEELFKNLNQLKSSTKKIILIGVSFALIDFAEKFMVENENLIVMETGGMKGRKKEITRRELHKILQKSFPKAKIQSEYGMTELLSQAYSFENEKFQTPPWMKIMIREVEDPFNYVENGKTGGINVIDFANLYSCSFIATDDLGKIDEKGEIEILGRFDHSDIRGCNLMAI